MKISQHVTSETSREAALALKGSLSNDQAEAKGLSPMDYFYYYNRASDEEGRQDFENCTPHIDRGYMSAIVCARTPGLELYVREQQCWVPIERYLRPYKDIVLIVNAKSEGMKLGCLSHSNEIHPLLPCIHRVGRYFFPRTSITYERR